MRYQKGGATPPGQGGKGSGSGKRYLQWKRSVSERKGKKGVWRAMKTEQILRHSVLALVGTVTMALGLALARPAAAQTTPLYKINGLVSDIPYVAQVTD